jgi:hypothetical protein
MATSMKAENNSNSMLNAVINGLKKEDLEVTKRSFHELKSKKNAYNCAHTEDQRWNMITYKKGKKSSL